jgi:hypothetical protein
LSNPVTLRGDWVILAALDDSMVNRHADFAIAVMKGEEGFPKEVGAFNDYEENKILCPFGPDGELLEIAYRWARTMLLAGEDRGIDVATVEEGIEEARAALRELGKINAKAKAKAITKAAGEIEGIAAPPLAQVLDALQRGGRACIEKLGR